IKFIFKNFSEDKKDNEDINSLTILMVASQIIAALIFLIVFCLYFSEFGFNGFHLSEKKEEWGQFGDFIGGILNPIVAGFALFWLITSVNLQIKELKKTNDALDKTVETAEKQQNQASIQNFESLFFQLLKTKNDSLDDIEYKKYTYGSDGEVTNTLVLKSVDAIKNHMIDFKSSPKKDWLNYYEENMLDYTGSYFRICYQIVKLIDNSKILSSDIPKDMILDSSYSTEQKKYFDIFRATLTKHEIEAFFFNCLNDYGNKKFKKLIEKYGLFEPLPIDNFRLNESNHRLTRYAYHYDPIIFEENNIWVNYYYEISKIDTMISSENLSYIFKSLKDLNIIKIRNSHAFDWRNIESNSGFHYEFMNHIITTNIFNFFSEKNINIIKNSFPYSDMNANISTRKETISNIQNHIKNLISYFKENKIKDYNDKIAPTSHFPQNKKSISELNEMIYLLNIEIQSYKDQIINLDKILSSIQYSEATNTVLLLIHYGISLKEYTNYLKSNQSTDNSPQQS
ncbi:MAG: putative phage abortive infection protein, partial [Pseudomonadota bacterium]